MGSGQPPTRKLDRRRRHEKGIPEDHPLQFARTVPPPAGDPSLKRGKRKPSAPSEIPVEPKTTPPPKSTAAIQKQGPLTPEQAVAMALTNAKYNLRPTEDEFIDRVIALLPEPHAKQFMIEQSTALRKVINCGRRTGKTTGATRAAIIKACQSKRVLLASTTQEQADAFWEYCKKWLEPFILAGDIEKNETRRTLIFHSTGGRIRVKTASDADTLRGDYADFLILDECALLDPKAWYEVGAPMLLDNGGEAWFLSTPRRRNWFFELYLRAQEDETGRWAYFHATSFDNPHLDGEALKEISQDLDEEGFKQEILAEFLPGQGAVFRNLDACLVASYDDPSTHFGHWVVSGVDWAQVNDYTVISVFCATCMRELHLERFNQLSWAIMRDRLVNTVHIWRVKHVLAESNSIGAPNIETLFHDDKLPIDGFDMNQRTKPQLVRAFSLSLERVTALWLPHPVAKAELEGYEATVSPQTGHVSYSAPKRKHDDTVVARMLAYHDAVNGSMDTGPSSVSYDRIPTVVYFVGDEDGAPSSLSYGGGAGYNIVTQAPPGRPW